MANSWVSSLIRAFFYIYQLMSNLLLILFLFGKVITEFLQLAQTLQTTPLHLLLDSTSDWKNDGVWGNL